MASTDVLIVGAGPSGIALANVLAELRVGFIIVDKKSGPVRESRVAVVHVPSASLGHYPARLLGARSRLPVRVLEARRGLQPQGGG